MNVEIAQEHKLNESMVLVKTYKKCIANVIENKKYTVSCMSKIVLYISCYIYKIYNLYYLID